MLGTNSVPQGQVRSGWDKAEAPALDTATFSASSRVSLVQICLPESKTHAYLVSVSPLRPPQFLAQNGGSASAHAVFPGCWASPRQLLLLQEGLGVGSR